MLRISIDLNPTCVHSSTGKVLYFQLSNFKRPPPSLLSAGISPLSSFLPVPPLFLYRDSVVFVLVPLLFNSEQWDLWHNVPHSQSLGPFSDHYTATHQKVCTQLTSEHQSCLITYPNICLTIFPPDQLEMFKLASNPFVICQSAFCCLTYSISFLLC